MQTTGSNQYDAACACVQRLLQLTLFCSQSPGNFTVSYIETASGMSSVIAVVPDTPAPSLSYYTSLVTIPADANPGGLARAADRAT